MTTLPPHTSSAATTSLTPVLCVRANERVPEGRLMFRNLRDLSTERPAAWGRLQGDGSSQRSDWPIFGLLQTTQSGTRRASQDGARSTTKHGASAASGGRVVVYGDSACLETTRSEWARHSYCTSLVLDAIQYALAGDESQTLGMELQRRRDQNGPALPTGI